jgi:hypothetical protein
MRAMVNNEIQALIQSFAAQIEALSKKAAIDQVLASLGGSTPATKRGRGPGRPKGSTNAAPTARAVIKPVKAGKRRSAAAMGSDVGTIRLPMKALIAAKKIKTQGQRRGMQYFVAGAAIPSALAAKKKSRRGNTKK